jgi:hypothetical protein
MLALMFAENIAHRLELRFGIPEQGHNALVLHECIRRKNGRVPPQDGFDRLDAIIGETKPFLQKPVIDLRLPAIALVLQDGSDTQGRVGAQEVRRRGIPLFSFGNDRYHQIGVVSQPPDDESG